MMFHDGINPSYTDDLVIKITQALHNVKRTIKLEVGEYLRTYFRTLLFIFETILNDQ